ncbi:MAG: DUF1579 family protein [Pyrinomonadaceae bacterium]
MNVDKKLSNLVGTWKGTNRLHTPWMPKKIHESESTAVVRSKMNGQFLSIDYTWSYEGETQEGMFVLGCDAKGDEAQAVWTDSWHSKNVLMLCNGTVDGNGGISVTGHYAVPENPDWGWRTQIAADDGSFHYVMYNASPEGVEELAVETKFTRA